MPNKKRKHTVVGTEKVLCNSLSNLGDFEDVLNMYREFNERNPPQYAVKEIEIRKRAMSLLLTTSQ